MDLRAPDLVIQYWHPDTPNLRYAEPSSGASTLLSGGTPAVREYYWSAGINWIIPIKKDSSILVRAT